MSAQKFSERPQTISKAGGYIPINLPIGGGEFQTNMISVSNLLSGVGNSGLQISNATGDLEIEITANTYIENISAKKISGTPTVKAGTTVHSGNILGDESEGAISIDGMTKSIVNYYYSANGFLHITVSGGYLDLRIDLIENYF